jgi:cbb3-type cytochrome oxidase subunit 3
MADQNYSNHSRYIPLWHLITPLIMLALLTGSIINLVKATTGNLYSASLILGINVLLIIFYWYSRAFALRAQDRAIRAEENYRHFILTGKPLDKNLRMRQIIALRFAPDEELPALAQRAVAEKLSPRDIKKAIKNWKGDFNRV